MPGRESGGCAQCIMSPVIQSTFRGRTPGGEGEKDTSSKNKIISHRRES